MGGAGGIGAVITTGSDAGASDAVAGGVGRESLAAPSTWDNSGRENILTEALTRSTFCGVNVSPQMGHSGSALSTRALQNGQRSIISSRLFIALGSAMV
jgi:hypothetical protein